MQVNFAIGLGCILLFLPTLPAQKLDDVAPLKDWAAPLRWENAGGSDRVSCRRTG